MNSIGSSCSCRNWADASMTSSLFTAFAKVFPPFLLTGINQFIKEGSFSQSGVIFLSRLPFPMHFHGLSGCLSAKWHISDVISGIPNGWFEAMTTLPSSGTFSIPSRSTLSTNLSIQAVKNSLRGLSAVSTLSRVWSIIPSISTSMPILALSKRCVSSFSANPFTISNPIYFLSSIYRLCILFILEMNVNCYCVSFVFAGTILVWKMKLSNTL